jgi:peptidyl-prolyl cis-trans isomerase SurA
MVPMTRPEFRRIHPATPQRWGVLAMMLVGLVLLWGCGGSDETSSEEELPPLLGSERIHVRHILVQYAGAYGAPADVHRSRASADSLIRSLHDRAAAGEDFADLARRYSDDVSGKDGGAIAALREGDAPPIFLRTAMALAPGALSEVFESPLGFHLVQRRNMDPIAAQHILIAYQGAVNAPDSLRRTRQEALDLAERVHAEVNHPDASFAVAARIYSDDEKTRPRNGFLGTFVRGTMDTNFEEAAFALKEFEISPVVETPYGFHIIRRVPDVTIRVAHILVTYRGTGAIDEKPRTREEALQRALDVDFRAKQGEDFGKLALEFSDDRRTNEKGGRLSPLRFGQAVAEFEDAAFNLSIGEVSDVVETQFGFHVIKRLY